MPAAVWNFQSNESLFWERAVFMAGPPLFFGMIFGFYRVNLPADYPLTAAIVVRWFTLQATWIGFAVCTEALSRLRRPTSRAGLWLTMVLGGLLGSVAMQPVRGIFLDLWVTHVVRTDLGTAFPQFESAVEFLAYHLGFTAVPVALWLATHTHFWAALSPRTAAPEHDVQNPLEILKARQPLSYKPVNMTQAAYGWPEFIRPTLTKIGADIIALHSEDHYVRVVSTRGSDLLRYRFKDAVRELRPLGFCQIHRTLAVNLAAIVDFHMKVQDAHVSMKHGENFPVSRSFRIPLREALDGYKANDIAQAAE